MKSEYEAWREELASTKPNTTPKAFAFYLLGTLALGAFAWGMMQL